MASSSGLLYCKWVHSNMKEMELWYWLYQYSLASLRDGSKYTWSEIFTLWILHSCNIIASFNGFGAKNSLSHISVHVSNFSINILPNESSILWIQDDIFEQPLISSSKFCMFFIFSLISFLLSLISEFFIWDKRLLILSTLINKSFTVSSKIEIFSDNSEINLGMEVKLLHVKLCFSFIKDNISSFCFATNLSITGSFSILLQLLWKALNDSCKAIALI